MVDLWLWLTECTKRSYNPKRKEWDERGEVYVRYGPPTKAEYNPLGAPLYFANSGQFQ